MSSFTRPFPAVAAPGVGVAATSPMAALGVPMGERVAAVQSGIASKYWIELVAYPPGSMASLWLLVNNVWKRYDNPPAYMSQIVQEALLGGATVRVWFDGEVVVGLVVNN